MRPHTRSVIAALVAAATALTGPMLAATPASAADPAIARIVVAPGGNDLNAGSADRPVATLATLPQQNRIELESLNSFTDRYSQ